MSRRKGKDREAAPKVPGDASEGKPRAMPAEATRRPVDGSSEAATWFVVSDARQMRG